MHDRPEFRNTSAVAAVHPIRLRLGAHCWSDWRCVQVCCSQADCRLRIDLPGCATREGREKAPAAGKASAFSLVSMLHLSWLTWHPNRPFYLPAERSAAAA
jgi:hypothetical protein